MRVPISAARRVAILAAACCTSAVPALGQSPQEAWTAVDRAFGRPGTSQPGDVQKYSFPRSDLRVRAGGVELKPALALGSWVALKRMSGFGGGAMAMGDLVLLETEVTPVISKLQSLGIQQTALHNHLQHESPSVMYLHIQAQGDPVKIGEAVRAALALTKTPSAPPAAAAPGAAFGLDTVKLANALGHPGKVTGGVYQVSIPRAESIRMGDVDVPPSMGVATALNFQPTGEGKAAITGDFVLTADEVNPVIRSLQDGGVEVTALHSHMLGEEPRLYFMHFWANDDVEKLGRALHAARSHEGEGGRRMSGQVSPAKVSLGALRKYFLWLGTFVLGGPIALYGRDVTRPRVGPSAGDPSQGSPRRIRLLAWKGRPHRL